MSWGTGMPIHYQTSNQLRIRCNELGETGRALSRAYIEPSNPTPSSHNVSVYPTLPCTSDSSAQRTRVCFDAGGHAPSAHKARAEVHPPVGIERERADVAVAVQRVRVGVLAALCVRKHRASAGCPTLAQRLTGTLASADCLLPGTDACMRCVAPAWYGQWAVHVLEPKRRPLHKSSPPPHCPALECLHPRQVLLRVCSASTSPRSLRKTEKGRTARASQQAAHQTCRARCGRACRAGARAPFPPPHPPSTQTRPSGS